MRSSKNYNERLTPFSYTVAFYPGVVKSDTHIVALLQQVLDAAVCLLENAPEGQKDYYLGSRAKDFSLIVSSWLRKD